MKKKKIVIFALAMILMFTACSKVDSSDNYKQTLKNGKIDTDNKERNEISIYPLEIEIKDLNGESYNIKIDSEPNRVITTSVSSTEMLLELGLKDKIIGIMKPDNKIEGKFSKDFEDLKVLGDKKTMSKEVVIAEKPDILIGRAVLFSGKGLPTIEEANKIGAKVIPQKASVDKSNPTIETSIQDFKTYARIFNLSQKAEEISNAFEKKLEDIDKFVQSKKSDKQKVLAMANFSGDRFGSFNITTGVPGDIMKRLNLEGYKTKKGAALTLENLISMNPDIIIYVRATRNEKNDQEALKNLKGNIGLKEIPAIKNNKIIEIAYDDLMDFGLRAVDTYERLADFIYENEN